MNIFIVLFVVTNAEVQINRDWEPILTDHLSYWTKIDKNLIDTTFNFVGSNVIFQLINNSLHIYDPNQICLCNNTHVKSLRFDFHMRRCLAMISILEELIRTTQMPDLEFVWSLDDIPFWNRNNESQTGILYPGFGAIRCSAKRGLAMPFFGSHEMWNINTSDEIIHQFQDIALETRQPVVIFRGGIDRGCSFERDTLIDFNPDIVFGPNRHNCGRQLLLNISTMYPQYVDYHGNNDKYIYIGTQSETYRYILSVEGFGGWTDRLYYLISRSNMVVFNQEHPCDQWFEPLLYPNKHYIPIKYDFRDLVGKVKLANENIKTMQSILNNVKEFSKQYLSKDGILNYMRTLLNIYAIKLHYNITLRNETYDINTLKNLTYRNNVCN